MPTFTEDAVPADPNELAFLRRVFEPAASSASVTRKRHGQFTFSDPTRGRVPSRQHVLAALPLANTGMCVTREHVR